LRLDGKGHQDIKFLVHLEHTIADDDLRRIIHQEIKRASVFDLQSTEVKPKREMNAHVVQEDWKWSLMRESLPIFDPLTKDKSDSFRVYGKDKFIYTFA